MVVWEDVGRDREQERRGSSGEESMDWDLSMCREDEDWGCGGEDGWNVKGRDQDREYVGSGRKQLG